MEGSGASDRVKDEEMDDATLFEHLKERGIFDSFRKECLSDVDTKPAYQNLQTRITSEIANFLKKSEGNLKITPANKQMLRNQLKNYLQEMDHTSGVERIVEQIVNPKMTTLIKPKVESEVLKVMPPVKEEDMNGVKEEIVQNGCDQMDNGQATSEDVEMKTEGGTESTVYHSSQVPVSLRPGMIPPPPPPDSRSASSNGGDSSPGLAGQISPLTPGRESPPPPAPMSPSVAAGDISPLTPTRGGDISPFTPPPALPEENNHDIPGLGAEGEIAMEVDSHTPPGSPPSRQSYTPPHSYTPTFPPPQDRFIQPHPVPFQRPLTPHTPPLPPMAPSVLDLESGGEASMSSISDGDMPDVSPPRQSPRSPSSSEEDTEPRGHQQNHRLQVPGAESQSRSGPSDISDGDLPSVGSDRPGSGASVDRAASAASADRAPSKESGEATSRGESAASAGVGSRSGGDQASLSGDENIENLEEMRLRLLAKIQEDFHVSPESDSEGEYHSNDDDDENEENKPVESNEDSSQPPADMSPVSDTSISVTPVPAIADPSSRPVSTEPLSSSSSVPDSPTGVSAPRTDTPSSPQPETSPSAQTNISPTQQQTSPSNISPNQLLRMRSLPIPPAKSLNTAQVLKTLPFPEGEGRPTPPEPEAPRKGPQTPPPPPCEPWDRPRGPRTPEAPQFSPERSSRSPTPDSEPLYYEKQTRDYDEPPSPPSAFSRDPSPPPRRGPRTPPIPSGPRTPPSSPPQSSFSRLDLSSEETKNTEPMEVESGCKPFVPSRRESKDSDGGSGNRFGGGDGGAPPRSGGTGAAGSTETKGPVSGSSSETVPTSKTPLPSKERTEKKKELINKQQKAKIEKYDQQIKTKERLKSDKFAGFDLFSTVKTPKSAHIPHRKPQDSGQKSPLATGTPKSSKSSRTSSSSSKSIEFNHKEKDKKGKSEESFLKPGKIPDRRSSLDVKKDSDSKSSSRDHEGRSSSGKERRTSTSSEKERRSSTSSSKEREKEKHKDRHSKEREREKNKEKEKHKERHRDNSEGDHKKGGEKSRKNSGEDDLKKTEKSDKDRGRDKSKTSEKSRTDSGDKHREKSEDALKQAVKSRKDSGEDDRKKTDKEEYDSNFEDAKQRLKLKREKMEKEEKEKKRKIDLEKREKDKARRKQLEKEKEDEKKNKIRNNLNGLSSDSLLASLAGLSAEDKKKLALQLLGDTNVKNKKIPDMLASDSSEDEDVPKRKEKHRSKSGGSTNSGEIKSPSSEKLVKNSAKKASIISSDDDSSDDDEMYVPKGGDSNNKTAGGNVHKDSPLRSTRSQIIKSMKENPVKVNVDRSLTKNIDLSKFLPDKNTEEDRLTKETKDEAGLEQTDDNSVLEEVPNDEESSLNPITQSDVEKLSKTRDDYEAFLRAKDIPAESSLDGSCISLLLTHLTAHNLKPSDITFPSEKDVKQDKANKLKSRDIILPVEKDVKLEERKSVEITIPVEQNLANIQDKLESPESPVKEEQENFESAVKEESKLMSPTEEVNNEQENLESPVEEVKNDQERLESPAKEVKPQEKLESPVKEVKPQQEKLELPVKEVKPLEEKIKSPVKEVKPQEKLESPVKEVKTQEKLESPVKEVKTQEKLESPVKEVKPQRETPKSPVKEVKNKEEKPSPVKEVKTQREKRELLVKEVKNELENIKSPVKTVNLESPVKELENKKETLESPPSSEKRGKKRSKGWAYVTEWVPDAPVPQTKVEKELLINNGAVDYLEGARGSAKRPRRANLKYSEEFTTGNTDSEEDVARSLSHPSAASTSSPTNKRTSSETIVTPKQDSVITPSPKNVASPDISPGGRKRNSSKQIIADYMRSAGVKRNYDQDKKVELGSISSPDTPANLKTVTQSTKDNNSVGKMLSATKNDPAELIDVIDADPSEGNNAGLANMERQLDRELASTDKEIQETMLFLSSKRKKRGSKGKSRVAAAPANESIQSEWNSLLKVAIKKVKSSKQACSALKIAGAIRNVEPALKDISNDDVEKKLDQAAKEGVVERIEKQEKITYRIAIRGASLKSATDSKSSGISVDDLESSIISSNDTESSQFSSEDNEVATNRVDSSDEMDDLLGFSSEEIREQNRILHFDTFDQLESTGAKFSNLDELEGVSLNDDLLKSEDEEPLKSSNLEVLFSAEIMMYIDNLKESEREHRDTVKSRGKSTGKSEDESDEKGSSSPDSFGSSKENQPTVSSGIGGIAAKRNHTPNKFMQEQTRKRRSGLQEGQSLKTRKLSA